MTLRIIEIIDQKEHTVGQLNENNTIVINTMVSIEQSMQNAVNKLRTIKTKKEKK